MKIFTKFGGPTSASYQVRCKGVRKTPQKRKKREIQCQSDIPKFSFNNFLKSGNQDIGPPPPHRALSFSYYGSATFVCDCSTPCCPQNL